ncbi:MAG: tripartite tricarboxylate transporter TctB family protein [Burkholderiaceae bacterium]|nr:tripartite tricarboxylate transporter TctB family protein [Burkholderiaceae bacterium]
MRIRNQRDFWSGVMFLVLGVLFVIFSQAYQLGTPARMGPGFFPTMLGALMALLGLGIAWRALSRSGGKADLEPVGWRELFLVLVAVGVFAAALPYRGWW